MKTSCLLSLFCFITAVATAAERVNVDNFKRAESDTYFAKWKSDPYEYSIDASAYYKGWLMDHAFLVLPAVANVANYLSTYKDSTPEPASFSINQVGEKLQSAINKDNR